MSARVLFTGSRRWTDEAAIAAVISTLPPDAVVLHGAAPGADAIVDRLARARGLVVEPYEADWSLGDTAGSLRNTIMLENGKPTEAHAFPQPRSVGTWDMVRKLRKAEVPVQVHGTGVDADVIDAVVAAADGYADSMASFDTETYRFSAGYMAPKIVCGSSAKIVNGAIRGELVAGVEYVLKHFEALLDANYTIVFANAAYDLAVLAQASMVAAESTMRLIGKIFKALRNKKIHCILLAQSLDAIYRGHLGLNPDGSEMRDPRTGKVTNRYSLEIVSQLLTGRTNAKSNDAWQQSYFFLDNVPVEQWPETPKIYPVEDATNTFENALVQVVGRPGEHEWLKVPPVNNGISHDYNICRWCKIVLETAPRVPPLCSAAPWVEPHKNLQNLAPQVAFDFAQKLGASHSLRTDPEKVEKYAAEIEKKHVAYIERFQKKGWIREDGSEDQTAVKRSIAVAYGATGVCKRCHGGVTCPKCDGTGQTLSGACRECGGLGKQIGKIQKIDTIDCRGLKQKGRYQNCLGPHCLTCAGTGKVQRPGNVVTCKNIFDEEDALIEEGCDGTGLDLRTAPLLPRTKNKEHPKRLGGVATDRDTAMESGDDDVSDYGENEFEKSRTTYVPYLRTGIDRPLYISGNALVATGRCSYEGCPLHQMPRAGGERNCIRARGPWCGYPIQMVLGSTDYEAGELCTLAQLCYWLFKFSQMRDAINKSGKPGILHSDLAAEVLGITLDEFLDRLKKKDKQAIDFRQMCKPINFGVPGGMGVAKLVLTSRKKNAGFTVCADGPARNHKGEPGYWGVRFCVLTGRYKRCGEKKLIDWKGYPCAPVCAACCEVVDEMLRPAYFRRYPEIKEYGKWAEKMMDKKLPAPCAVWNAERGKPEIVRERWTDEITAFRNNGFQAMLADIGKDAFVTATEECYTGVKADGSPSPLAGCRLPLYLHDEPLSELILSTAHLSGPRIAEVMMESGRKFAPDVTWKAETALAHWWDKSMEPVYDPFGKLVPWGPVPDELKIAA